MVTTTRATATGAPERLPWTGDDQANRLIAADPNALLIGFVLDQQVTVQKAFTGPLTIRQRLGTLDPATLAGIDQQRMRDAFASPPAIHRFPGAMADRVRALCALLATEYGGDASRIWRDAKDAKDLSARLGKLPGIGPMKARTIIILLGTQYGVTLNGWETYVPDHPTLGQVTTPEELTAYQTQKRAWKAQLRAAGMDTSATWPEGTKPARRTAGKRERG